jgi:hypothetical protein
MAETVFENGHSYAFSRRFPFDWNGHPIVALHLLARDGTWQEFPVVADTGADMTLMPRSDASRLGISDIERGYVQEGTLGTAGLGSVTAFFHRFLATVPGSEIHFPVLVGFSPNTRCRLFRRSAMAREFVLVFDSQATHFLRD